MRAGAGDRDRPAALVARPDPQPQFQLVIEIARRAEAGHRLAAGLALAVRPMDVRVRHEHRRCPAVIAHRHVFVVRQQRGVGPELPSDIGRVMDAGIEIRVVADRRRQVQRAIRRRRQASTARRSLLLSASRSERRRRSAWRGAWPSAISGLSTGPAAALAASAASPASTLVACSAPRSRIASPIATPPRRLPSPGSNTPKGRFWIGKSAWLLAEATQLRRAGSFVWSRSSVMGISGKSWGSSASKRHSRPGAPAYRAQRRSAAAPSGFRT